jgi:peptide/nickel transport system substrate-binding protein
LTLTDVASVHGRGLKVVFKLKTPDYNLPQIMGGRSGMIISPTAFRSNAAALATAPVGDGPYKLTSLQQGGDVTLVRNPSYWDVKNVHLAKIVLHQIPDEASRIAAMESGQINFGTFNGLSAAPLQKAGFKVLRIPVEQTQQIDINGTVAPFTDPRVVQAINYAIDRRAIVGALQGGYGFPNTEPWPPGYVAYDAKMSNLYPYNPAKAKQLLAAAGFPNGFTVTMGEALISPQDAMAQIVQQQLAQVGITVNLEPVSAADFATVNYVQRKYAIFTDGFSGRESPLLAVAVLFGPQGNLNAGRQYPQKLADAVNKAAATPVADPNYPALIKAVTDVAVQTQPTVFVYNIEIPASMAKNVRGFTKNPIQVQLDGMCIAK